MAFENDLGQSVSFECSDLISELIDDIIEFGENMMVEVITEEKNGGIIYKDYNFIENDEETSFCLLKNEKIKKMPASVLLALYERQNSIF